MYARVAKGYRSAGIDPPSPFPCTTDVSVPFPADSVWSAELGTKNAFWGGRAQLELSVYYKPDVVVMDLVMPGMDGVAATRQIVEKAPDVRVVMLTSSDSEEVGRHLKRERHLAERLKVHRRRLVAVEGEVGLIELADRVACRDEQTCRRALHVHRRLDEPCALMSLVRRLVLRQARLGL